MTDLEEIERFIEAVLGKPLQPWQRTFLKAILTREVQHNDAVLTQLPHLTEDTPWPNGVWPIDGRWYTASTTYGRGDEIDVTDEYHAWMDSLPHTRELSVSWSLPTEENKKENE